MGSTNRVAKKLIEVLILLLPFIFSSPALSQYPSEKAQTEASKIIKQQVLETYGKLPLSFEANRGQCDSQVKFLSRGRGYKLFLTPTEATLSLRSTQVRSGSIKTKFKRDLRFEKVQRSVIHMQFIDANQNPEIVGLRELPGKSNYFIGNDRKQWHTHVPHYSKVQYRDIYPGVDLLFYGNQRRLEYDFVISPSADPKSILMRFMGADKLDIDAQGNLILQVAGHKIVQRPPLVYQWFEGQRREISSHYVIKNKSQIAFKIAAYDSTRPLVIDPKLVYSTYLGGSVNDWAHGIAVDASRNVYVAGYTSSTDFPTNAAAFQSANGGGLDVFVIKINPTGSAFVYSAIIGGGDWDYGNDIAVDNAGNVYLTGQTKSSEFPTVNAFQTANNGGGDAFMVKLNPEGTGLVYSTYLGGQGLDAGIGIAVDSLGSVYLTGNSFSADFPTTAGALFTDSDAYMSDAFVTKVNPGESGQDSLLYSTYLHGLNDFSEVYGQAIAADQFGNAYVTGLTNSIHFPTNLQAFQTTKAGGMYDAFVTKMSPDGTFFWYSTYLGGTGSDEGKDIAVDSAGNAFVTGHTNSTNFPTQNPLQSVNRGVSDIFITKLNPDGSALIYSTYLGGNNYDLGFGIAVDHAGNACLTGETVSTDFPTMNQFQGIFGGGNGDAFVAIINSDGSTLLYSTYLGGNNKDIGRDIAIDSAGNAYLTGETSSADFPTVNPFQNILGGSVDAFVVKIRSIKATPWIPLLLLDD